ncbi:Chromate resistance protein ChrB [Nonomuraea sp. NPDC050663]|uniref:Chromate resistance protein ChrB n=1 Tax=Nonomuraea sp. NPDC050663 TaxID=3364370 RepID=UPI00379B85AE
MTGTAEQWVLLAYRIPRQPSTLRITIWRKLDRLGVARLGDGLVALPADARTREQLEWIAQEISEVGGSSTLWLALPGSPAQAQAIAEEMRQARAAEYRSVIEQVQSAKLARPGERVRAVKRLQAELRRIRRRDYFPPAEREAARLAVRDLNTSIEEGAS